MFDVGLVWFAKNALSAARNSRVDIGVKELMTRVADGMDCEVVIEIEFLENSWE